jgi:uncharacterized protein with NAD-binding domain and iron-sulfur cluster
MAGSVKKKIAILGGGMGGLAAAFGLTEFPDWQNRYEITIYQVGWRLGGKAASGRNARAHQRIEEHGLHVWMGFYENAFRMMRTCYAELNRPPGCPLATWQDAFKPLSTISWEERLREGWLGWRKTFAEYSSQPGNGQPLPSLWEGMRRGIAWMLQTLKEADVAKGGTDNNRIRRFWTLWDIAVAVIRGTLLDGVLLHGLDSLDDWDLSDWLRHHGASQHSVDSPLVRGIYDCFLAYRNGDLSQPALAAGVGLRLIYHIVMRYQGAIFWKMEAGMGDTVIAPLYQVLKGRGVKFNFFHQVKALQLSAARDCIETIRVGRQVNLKGAEYDPLLNVNELLCWPSEPLYDQIVEGESLQALAINLESAWTVWTDVSEVTLQRGTDFDLVILATSLAPLKDICKELIAVNTSWQNMIEQVQTTPSQAVQLWLKPSLASLGWSGGPTILTAYAHPLETWADMSQVLKWEAWPSEMKPGNTSYFCGPLPDLPNVPPYTEHDFPGKSMDVVKQKAIVWLQQHIGHLWPDADDDDTGFNWELLVDPHNSRGLHRFDSQYWRANVSPADRYVQSLPGTTRYRLKAHESGFTNLYLAGDWIRTGLNIGCIESAVMGGLQASQAIWNDL